MDEPSRLSKAFALSGGAGRIRQWRWDTAQLLNQWPKLKDIGWSSSKKWSRPIFFCVSRDVWAWRAELWQRKVWMEQRGWRRVRRGGQGRWWL